MSKNLFLLLICTIIIVLGLVVALHWDESNPRVTTTPPHVTFPIVLDVIRDQIPLYKVEQGRPPWAPGEVAEAQWRPLVENRYLWEGPPNPYCPDRPEISTRIVSLSN